MICLDCQHSNGDSLQYCRECGAPLEEVKQNQTEIIEENSAESINVPPVEEFEEIQAVEDTLVTETESSEIEELQKLEEDGVIETLSEPEIAEELSQEETTEEPEIVEPIETEIRVDSFCDHVIGNVKENDQDYCQILNMDYPLHNYRVVLMVGSDGIGGHTGGERWSHATVNMVTAAIGTKMPAFDSQEKYLDRHMFGDFLYSKVEKNFFPMIEWASKCIYHFGIQEVGDKRLFGCTLVIAMMICDLETGTVVMHEYSIGDSSIFLITKGKVEKISADHSENGKLRRYIGKGLSADGKLNSRLISLDLEKLKHFQVLMCSDGLTNMLSEQEIFNNSFSAKSASQAVSNLISAGLSVTTPYGQIMDPDQDPPYEPGDDNIFAAITDLKILEKK